MPAARPSQQSRSTYRKLAVAQDIGERTVLLKTSLRLARHDSVYVETDGTFAPLSVDAAARIFVEVDGRRVTNESTIDWRGSIAPARHSFNAVGATRLDSGRHTVALVAAPLAGRFRVAASSNLSVLVHPATRVSVGRLRAEAGPFDFTSVDRGHPDLPHAAVAAVRADLRSTAVALASGTTRLASSGGDAMLGIYLDGRHPGNASSLWTVNDMCSCAETQAPLYTHALLRRGRRRSTVTLDASEYPWNQPNLPPIGEDTAIYTVRPSATLVVLDGGMRVVGRGSSTRVGYPDLTATVWDWSCVATGALPGTPHDPNCPPINEDVLLAQETFRVPAGHPGVVMFAAKARVQAGSGDLGGPVTLWLTIDGVRRGSTGVQELVAPSSISQRTISASYLTAGERRLRPGWHTVRVFGHVSGSFFTVGLSRDLPLVWFD